MHFAVLEILEIVLPAPPPGWSKIPFPQITLEGVEYYHAEADIFPAMVICQALQFNTETLPRTARIL